MRVLSTLDEPYIVLEFLKAEIDSVLFKTRLRKQAKKLRTSLDIIKNPNLKSAEENRLRKAILSGYRKFGTNTGFFIGFPNDIQWYKCMLDIEDLMGVKYINSDVWLKYTDCTRKPEVFVKKIMANYIGNKHVKVIKQAAKLLDNGAKFPEILLVTKDKTIPEVVLEGHHRLSSYIYYIVTRNIKEFKLEAIVGYSKGIINWKDY